MNVFRATAVGLSTFAFFALSMATPALADPPALWPQNLREIEQAASVRPDDRADRRLPVFTDERAPAVGEGFDWSDAVIGAAAALGLVGVAAGTSISVKQRRAAAVS
jgi:hypothetical protein